MNKNMLRQAQQLQARLAKAQEELESAEVEGTAGGGVVKVVVTGKMKVQSVEISPEAVNPEDVEMLQDLVMAATNEALDKAQEMAQTSLGAITGGMKIPGLM
ncbi:MAG: YbaB/EbfC family nucleoid-associated protein [Chloroflexi bacterium]|nr:YbaB/EbfC family nucleoid-associated protein [Chloroflexota bacterium]